jgi:hypothetical protein
VQEPLETIDGFKNEGKQWLTYESIFNHTPFRHSHQQMHEGAFRAPLANTRIVLLNAIDEATLTSLRMSFFPDMKTNNELKACIYQPWAGDLTDKGIADAALVVQNAKSQIQGVSNTAASAVFPYNYAANEGSDPAETPSRSIGTDPIVTK